MAFFTECLAGRKRGQLRDSGEIDYKQAGGFGKEKWEGRSHNMFTVEMIAPCGLDCSLCSYAQKKVIPCPGCSGPNENNRGEQYGKEG